MKFWLTVVVAIVVMSSAGTWLSMKGGAQTEPVIPEADKDLTTRPPAAEGDKPKFEWVDGGRFEGNVVEIAAGDSPRDVERSAQFRFRNAGKAPLEIELLGLSCECLRELTLDGQPVKMNERPKVKPPGSEGVIKLSWKPTEKQFPASASHPREMRFTAKFFTSDLNYPDLHMEIKTRLVHPEETRK